MPKWKTVLPSARRSLRRRMRISSNGLNSAPVSAKRHSRKSTKCKRSRSLGQVTGGVAHDFNNLLMVILANLDLARSYISDNPRALRLIDGALQGAERGATLTKRLLAFSRQQELKPEVVDVTRLVDGMIEMLRRSLGPTIEIMTEFEPIFRTSASTRTNSN